MVRIYMFIVCLVLLLWMSTCVPVWAAQPSASYGYDAATHCDHSLDSDCQNTPPGCSYVALEHKTDCIHSESRTNNTGLFGILCWSSIIVVGYLSVSRDYDTPSNKFNNSPHRPNYDVRIEPRCTSTTTLKNDMSQYRAYFVPGGVDPFGLDYHHWFANLGGRGQKFIDCKCEDIKVDIDRYTTWYDGVIANNEHQGGLFGDTPHGYLHHTLKYHKVYELVVGEAETCCQALLATWALAEIYHDALRNVKNNTGFARSKQNLEFGVLSSLRWHDTETQTVTNTSVEFLGLLAKACGDGKTTPIGTLITQKDTLKKRLRKELPRLVDIHNNLSLIHI